MYREADGHGHTDTHTHSRISITPMHEHWNLPHPPHCEVHSCVVTLHGAYVPCCAAVSVSISIEGPSSAVGAPLCELGDDSSEGGAEKSGAACAKVDQTVKVEWSSVWFIKDSC